MLNEAGKKEKVEKERAGGNGRGQVAMGLRERFGEEVKKREREKKWDPKADLTFPNSKELDGNLGPKITISTTG